MSLPCCDPWPQFEQLAQFCLGLRQSPSVVQSQAKIVAHSSTKRIPCHRPAVQADGLVEAPECPSQDTGAVQRVGVPGIERKDLPHLHLGTRPIPS